MARRQERRFELGCLLLAYELYSVGMDNIPPVTLLVIIGQALLFMRIINPPWNRYEVCLSGESILYGKDYHKLFLSAVEHADDIHLYYNMASLLLKGRSLERRYGPLKFLILLVIFTATTSLTYVGLAWGATEVFQTNSYMKHCAIGFSGVLFALKVLSTHYGGSSFYHIHGMQVPSEYAVWVELLLIHILVPRSSFIGHLAGILVGFAYILGPLRSLVDVVHSAMSGMTPLPRPSYTYAQGTVGSGPQVGNREDDPPPDREEVRQWRTQRFQY